MNKRLFGPVALAASAAACAPASAAIIGTTGWMTPITPPTSTLTGSNYCWNEQTNITLGSVMVNTFGPWTINYGGTTPFPIGGTFDSHMISFFSVTGVSVLGSVSFSQNIIAVIYDQQLLDLTDASCGSLITLYPTAGPRGFNSPFVNGYININLNVFSFDLRPTAPHQGSGEYEFRVLTAVPAPGPLALASLGLVCVRRKRPE